MIEKNYNLLNEDEKKKKKKKQPKDGEDNKVN